jgi:hypothetical protein
MWTAIFGEVLAASSPHRVGSDEMASGLACPCSRPCCVFSNPQFFLSPMPSLDDDGFWLPGNFERCVARLPDRTRASVQYISREFGPIGSI